MVFIVTAVLTLFLSHGLLRALLATTLSVGLLMYQSVRSAGHSATVPIRMLRNEHQSLWLIQTHLVCDSVEASVEELAGSTGLEDDELHVVLGCAKCCTA